MLEQLQNSLLPLNDPSKSAVDLKCAAVLLPIVSAPSPLDWQVIFTRRAEHLNHHAGQISFPGGGYETQDQDLSETATRETFEEIGIIPEHIRLLGKLPQQKTISQYNITPFVGMVNSSYRIKIDPNEVAEVFTAPFTFVTDERNQKKVTQTIDGKEYSFYVIEYQHYFIWGATAKILVNLSRRLNN